MHPLAAKRQQWRGPAGRQPAQGVIAFVQQWTSGKPKSAPGTEIADARVPEGNPRTVRSCEPPSSAAPEEAPQKASWADETAPVAEYGTRVPSLLLTLAACERQEETARALVDGRRRTVRRAASRRPSALRALGQPPSGSNSVRGSHQNEEQDCVFRTPYQGVAGCDKRCSNTI